MSYYTAICNMNSPSFFVTLTIFVAFLNKIHANNLSYHLIFDRKPPYLPSAQALNCNLEKKYILRFKTLRKTIFKTYTDFFSNDSFF